MKLDFICFREDTFRDLGITPLIYPGSKHKRVDYLFKYKGLDKRDCRGSRYFDPPDSVNAAHQRESGQLKYIWQSITGGVLSLLGLIPRGLPRFLEESLKTDEFSLNKKLCSS